MCKSMACLGLLKAYLKITYLVRHVDTVTIIQYLFQLFHHHGLREKVLIVENHNLVIELLVELNCTFTSIFKNEI